MLLVILLACASDDTDGLRRGAPSQHDDTDADTGSPETPPVDGCRATPRAADRDRVVLLARPYDASANQADTWAVLKLAREGALAETGQTLDLGRAYWGTMRFTPDGSVGIAPLEDGTLGVVAIDEDNQVSVVHAGLGGEFYASAVTVHPSGERVWIVDGNWPENGGGLYVADIDCETGELSAPARVLEAKLPAALLPTAADGSEGVIVGREVAGAEGGEDAALVDLDTMTRLAGDDLFGDDDASFSGAALTPDGAWLLVGDNSLWSGVPNRVAVASLGSGLATTQVLSDLEDPMAVVTSPHGGHALVVSGYGDAIFVLAETGEPTAPFDYAGELGYAGSRPALPADAVQVLRGPLEGLVLVAENLGIRRVMLGRDGPEDLGLWSAGSGYEHISGALGVQP